MSRSLLATWLAPLALIAVTLPAAAADHVPGSILKMARFENRPEIRDRAIEIGLAGDASRIDGATAGTATLHLGVYRTATSWLLGLAIEPAFTHVPGANLLDVQAAMAWSREMGMTSAYLFLGPGGGLRERWSGGARTRSFPLGGNAGVVAMLSDHMAVRVEYRFRRVVDDTGSDHDEQKLLLGFSVFARNASKPWIH